MANSLKAAREELAVQLRTAGMTVYAHVPERITPPVAVIEPGAPYVESGETFCDWRVNLNVVIFAATAMNEVATDQLDQYLVDVVDNVDTFDLRDISQPAQFEANGAFYLGARISFTTIKDI